MTEDDFIALISPKDRELIKGVVLVLEALRNMDADRLSTILSQVRLASSLFPKEMVGAIESLEADFTLVLAFIDQAKKYDRSDKLWGKKDEGPKTS